MNDKEKEKKLRRLKHLMYCVGRPFFVPQKGKTGAELMKQDMDSWLSLSKSKFFFGSKSRADRHEVYRLIAEIGLDIETAYRMWCEQSFSKHLNKVDWNAKPAKEGRDNKGVYVGHGGSNGNKVRYPSKKRSKRVWRIFYSMFPYHAQRDGWDGESSSRYDGGKR